MISKNKPVVKSKTAKPKKIAAKENDVTERKQAEQEANEAKEKAEEKTIQLLQLENNLKNAMVYQLAWTVMENGEVDKRIGHISDMVTKFYGCTPEQALADSNLIYNKIHPDDVQRLIDEEAAALKNMTAFDTVVRVFNPDGGIRWSHYISTPRKHAGKIYWDGIEIDVTERKRVEEALQKNEERLRSIFNAMSEGFSIQEVVCDDNGHPRDLRFVEANPAFERQTGLKNADTLGHTLLELFPQSESYWIERYGKVGLTGEPTHFEAMLGPLNIYYQVSAFQTEFGRFGVLFTDINERKQAEERIKTQLDELQRWQDAMLDREDRVQELKREVNELCRRSGEAARYPSQADGAADSGEANL